MCCETLWVQAAPARQAVAVAFAVVQQLLMIFGGGAAAAAVVGAKEFVPWAEVAARVPALLQQIQVGAGTACNFQTSGASCSFITWC